MNKIIKISLILVLALIAGIGSKRAYFHFFDTPKHHFDNDVMNIGEIPFGREKTIYFAFENTGNGTLNISSVTSNCKCTFGNWQSKSLKRGFKDSIQVFFTPLEPGYFSQEIIVHSNDEDSPKHLWIQGIAVSDKNVPTG